MAEVDETPARFAQACQRSAEYPLTLLRTEAFSHQQNALQKRLGQEPVFHPSDQALVIRDLQENSSAFDKGQKLETVDQVEAHLVPEDKDPWWRFM